MLPDDDLIPIPPAAEGGAAAEALNDQATAPAGVEIVELIADFGAAGASVDLAALFEGEAPEAGGTAETDALDSQAESPTVEGFAITFPAGFTLPDNGSVDGGVL